MDFFPNPRALQHDSPLIAFQRLHTTSLFTTDTLGIIGSAGSEGPNRKWACLLLFWSSLDAGSLISDLIDGWKLLIRMWCMLLPKRDTKHFPHFVCVFHLGGNVLTYSRSLDPQKHHWGGRSLNFCGNYLPLSWFSYVLLRHLKYLLLPAPQIHST